MPDPGNESLDEERPCKHCGAVLALARLVRVNVQGEYEYACQECAVGVGSP